MSELLKTDQKQFDTPGALNQIPADSRWFATKWSCSDGGPHRPNALRLEVELRPGSVYYGSTCAKCGRKIAARWELG